MLSDVPPIFRKRRGRVKPQPTPPVPPGPPVYVVSVNTDDPPSAGYSYWLFDRSADLTAPPAPPTGLQVLVGGLWLDPVSATQSDFTSMTLLYDTAEALDGKPWRIVVTPSGIVQAADIVLPQTGTVEAP